MKHLLLFGILLVNIFLCQASEINKQNSSSMNLFAPDSMFLSHLNFSIPDFKTYYGMDLNGINENEFRKRKSITLTYDPYSFRRIDGFAIDDEKNIYIYYWDNNGFINRAMFDLVNKQAKQKRIKATSYANSYDDTKKIPIYPLKSEIANGDIYFSIDPPMFISTLTLKRNLNTNNSNYDPNYRSYNSSSTKTWLRLICMPSIEDLLNILDYTTQNKLVDYVFLNQENLDYNYCLRSPTFKGLVNVKIAKANEEQIAAKKKEDALKAMAKATDDAAKAQEEINAFRKIESKAIVYYDKEIKDELSKSSLFMPRGEFESLDEYKERQKAADTFSNEVIKKYAYRYMADTDKKESERIEKIKNSYSQINLKIAQLGTYNTDQQIFPVIIEGFRPMELKVPLQEAKSFKENINSIKVLADKQLDENGVSYRFFNFAISHPVTGSKYYLNQSKPLYLDYVAQNIAEAGVPKLDVAVQFFEPSGNRLLDGDEKAKFEVIIKNTGTGSAQNIKISLSAIDHSGFTFDNTKTIIGIAPNQNQTVSFDIIANRKITDKEIKFTFNFSEARGFNPTDINYSINSQSFKSPLLLVKDVGIKEITGNGNNIIENGENIEVSVLIQNSGQGRAENAKAIFDFADRNILSLTPDKMSQNLSDLNPGESKLLTFNFTVNNVYSGSDLLPMKVTLSEKYNEYGGSFPLNLEMKKVQLAAKSITIKGQYDQKIEIKDVSLTSDVDKNIPEGTVKNSNRFALIIGNEDYSTYQSGLNTELNVEFARNDAQVFKQYCEKTLGVAAENITFLPDATAAKINQALTKMNLLAKNSNGQGDLIFYYAGHGLPDENTKEPYLIPVDVSGTNFRDGGIKLSSVYEKLTEYPSQKVSVFIDACFSGGARNQGLLAARGVKMKPKESVLSGNIVVFSASSGEQSSLPYKDKQHGMFTYFLLKKIQETKGDISFTDLAQYVKSQVSLQSVNINSKEQTPVISAGTDKWENWKLK